ncbi:MAG: hypothetical protein RQM90_05150 [Methanoculleus sp.]
MNRQTQKRVFGITAVAAAAMIWQVIAVYVVGRPFILPSVTDVAGAFADLLTSVPSFSTSQSALNTLESGSLRHSSSVSPSGS